ncbi:hypothetical protein FQA39_LY08405 [Lamprigera yunnana]|nr:hypothetical protein FQA39_LY08405 [Lamprigera yunnana]
MSKVLNPFVYWAQSEENLFIKVDLKDAENTDFVLEERKLQFESKGVGAHGSSNYGFALDFYSKIDSDASTCKVLGSKIDFNIIKAEKGWWPRLTSKPQKPGWLKIDFDRWQSEDDVNSEEEKVRDVRDDYADLYEKLQKEEFGYTKEDIKKVYLIIYNLMMFVGFTYIVTVLAIRYIRDGAKCFPEIYDVIGTTVRYLHILQFSEVILVLIKWTSGSLITSFIQIGGRIAIILLLIDPEPRIQVDPVVSYLYLIWSSIEIIRYPFYIAQVCKINLSLLTWLRYSAWIVLYPLGLSSEVIIVYKSIPFLDETKRFSLSLPNQYNISFALVTLLRIYLVFLAFPVAYMLISHMYKARVKKFGLKHRKQIKS